MKKRVCFTILLSTAFFSLNSLMSNAIEMPNLSIDNNPVTIVVKASNLQERTITSQTPLKKDTLQELDIKKQEFIDLSPNINKYNNELDKLKIIFDKNLKPMAMTFLSIYDLYDVLIEYEKYDDNSKGLRKYSNIICNKIIDSTYKFEKQGDKTVKIYASVPRESIFDLQTAIYNLSVLQSYNQNVLALTKREWQVIKKNPNKKILYKKEQLKDFSQIYHLANSDFKKVKKLKKEFILLAKANNINYNEVSTIRIITKDLNYIELNSSFSAYPQTIELEQKILSMNKNSNLGGDEAIYYKNMDNIQQSVLNTLSSLLLSEDMCKELELKKKYVNEKNISEEEKESQLLRIYKEEESAILKELESNDINLKISNFTKIQKNEYIEVNKKLFDLLFLSTGYLIDSTAKLLDNFDKMSKGYKIETPTKEEIIYTSILRKKYVNSSELLSQKLQELNKINNLDKEIMAYKQVKKIKKIKKAKMIKEEDLDF